jgi:hypothetical protein
MRSSHDSYRQSSLAPSPNRNYRHTTPSNYLDLNSSVGASDRAEFRDRYQNRVKKPNKSSSFFPIKITFSSIILVCMA